jgi:hypothetical protein
VGFVCGHVTSLNANILKLSGIKIRFLGRRNHNLIPILTESSRLPEAQENYKISQLGEFVNQHWGTALSGLKFRVLTIYTPTYWRQNCGIYESKMKNGG